MTDKRLYGGPYSLELQESVLTPLADYLDALEDAKVELLSQFKVVRSMEDGEEITDELMHDIGFIDGKCDALGHGFNLHRREIRTAHAKLDDGI